MALPIVAGLAMAGGTALNMYGTRQRDKATSRALKDYQNAVNARAARQRASLAEESGMLAGLADERQRGVGGYLDELAVAQFPQSDEGAAARQQGALADISARTGTTPTGGYAYSGAPRTQSESMQTDITKNRNAELSAKLLADARDRQITERERLAGNKMALMDLLRNSKGKSMEQKMALARALEGLDAQMEDAAMQGNLNEAMKKGQWANALGGLTTQLGSMGMMAGLSGAGGAGAAGGAAGGAAAGGAASPYAGAYASGNLPLGGSSGPAFR